MTVRLGGLGIVALLLPMHAHAHSGGLNAQGCHIARKTGEYHCHRVPSAQQTNPNRSSSAKPLISGTASVVDGDTLEIRGQKIRLHGIDAPESAQTCTAGGRTYRCGQEAALALSDKIGRSSVSCEPRDKDKYGRIIAVCRLDGEDLDDWMVRQGYALAYRRFSADYVAAESLAQHAKRGIWRGEFVAPWDWRDGRR